MMDESKLPLNWLQGITGGASGGGDQQQQNGGTSVEALWALRQGPTIFILKNVMYCSDVDPDPHYGRSPGSAFPKLS